MHLDAVWELFEFPFVTFPAEAGEQQGGGRGVPEPAAVGHRGRRRRAAGRQTEGAELATAS